MSNNGSISANSLEKVMSIKSDIEALLGQSMFVPVIPQKAMVQLTKLSMVDMTWSVLEETQIGFTVNDLRHASNNYEVKKKGKDLLKKWKKLNPVLVPVTKEPIANETQEATEKVKRRNKSGENKKGTRVPRKSSVERHRSCKVLKVGTARIRTDGEGGGGAQEDENQFDDWSVQSVTGIKLILSKPKEQKASPSPVKKRKKRVPKMSFLAT